jgi:hypothetical protein
MMAAIAAIGVAVGAAGLIGSNKAANDANAAQQQMLALQRQQMEEQRKQMELDALRRKRDIIRQSIAARSVALTTATAQGAQLGTGLQGAYGVIGGREGSNLLALSQNLTIGRNMADLKMNESFAQSRYANAQSQLAFYQGLTSLGGGLLKNLDSISRVGTTFGNFATKMMA